MSLPKYTLVHNQQKSCWDLKEDGSGRVGCSFGTKEEALRGGALEAALGPVGGSVKIQKLDGTYEEERTFPRSADPRRSPG